MGAADDGFPEQIAMGADDDVATRLETVLAAEAEQDPFGVAGALRRQIEHAAVAVGATEHRGAVQDATWAGCHPVEGAGAVRPSETVEHLLGAHPGEGARWTRGETEPGGHQGCGGGYHRGGA